MQKIKQTILNISFLAGFALMLAACQKMERPKLGDYPKDDAVLPGGPLRFFLPFGGTNVQPRYNVSDSISTNPAVSMPLLLVDGINGKAIKGADGQAIKYLNINDFGKSTSFSIAFWLKNAAQAGRTEFVFSLVDDKYGWHHSAVFLLVENQTPTQSTMKMGLMDQWLEGTFSKPLFDNQWHHLAYVYDQATSKMTYYFDGQVVTGMTPTQTDVKNGGNPRGAVDFSTVTNLVLGGWNKHIGAAGPTDDWIKSYNGSLDQFRLYNKALSASEVNALFTGKL